MTQTVRARKRIFSSRLWGKSIDNDIVEALDVAKGQKNVMPEGTYGMPYTDEVERSGDGCLQYTYFKA